MQRTFVTTVVMFMLALLAGTARAQSDGHFAKLDAINAEISAIETTLAKTEMALTEQAQDTKWLVRAFELGRSKKRIAQGIEEVRAELKAIGATLSEVDADAAALRSPIGEIMDAANKLGDTKLMYAAKQTLSRLGEVEGESARQRRILDRTAGQLDELAAQLNK